jgi:hypothetical protein
MAATYDSTLSTDKDKVRFYIQDTDTANAQMQDEEITAMISLHGSYKEAAIVCCETLAMGYAGQDDSRKIGNMTLSNFFAKSKRYLELAKILKARFSNVITPYAGGISVSGKETYAEDSDIVQPAFKRNMMDNSYGEEL